MPISRGSCASGYTSPPEHVDGRGLAGAVVTQLVAPNALERTARARRRCFTRAKICPSYMLSDRSFTATTGCSSAGYSLRRCRILRAALSRTHTRDPPIACGRQSH
jgi:hypothetical protein